MIEPIKINIAIAGSGFGGLCMGAKLRAAGFDDFVILEKAHAVGGTWRENRYPGAECDIASVLYSYSFYPNPTWDFKWAKQKQILEYLNNFTDDMGLRPHIEFGCEIVSAEFDETRDEWKTVTASGQTYISKYLIMSLGQLHHPKTPDIQGAETFEGAAFHTAQWPSSVDLTGKNVAIIGNAASAIQAIPEIAKTAKSLTIYQRTANWILPKRDRPYSRLEKKIAKIIPGLSKLYRGFWFGVGEFILYPIIKGKKGRSALGRFLCRMEMKAHIKDPKLRAKLTPDYPIGAKRILLSETYYPALAQNHVELVTAPIKRIRKEGIDDNGGSLRQHDIIVYATGFHTHPFYNNITVKGIGGTSLSEKWTSGAYAYHGVMTSGFPNLFMIYGPNTNTGHTSIIYKIENQVGYIIQLLQRAENSTVDVKEDAETEFNREIQTRLSQTSWAKVDQSWYKTGDIIDLNWPGSGFEYKKRMKTPHWDHFSFR